MCQLQEDTCHSLPCLVFDMPADLTSSFSRPLRCATTAATRGRAKICGVTPLEYFVLVGTGSCSTQCVF